MRTYLTAIDARYNVFTGAQEHNFYLDSPGFAGDYAVSTILVGNQSLTATGRTGIQLVDRIYPAYNNLYVGAPGRGQAIIRNNILHSDSSAGGGSVITIAGHHDPVWIENNHITQTGGGGGSVDTGGILSWTPLRTWLLPSGHSVNGLFVNDNTIVGTGSRPNISPSGCRIAWVGNNTLQAAGHGVDFNDNATGGNPMNSASYLPSSTMPGWQQGGCKARDRIGGSMTCLTSVQIDTDY